MSDYAIGDVQGCYDALQRLLDHINFNPERDRLWFVGDLVNRGPDSLAVLRFIKQLPITPRITLGNHDLHLLCHLFIDNPYQNHDDTLDDIVNAHDAQDLGHWLRWQPILFHDAELNVIMCHAGIAPFWDLAQALFHAREFEQALAGNDFRDCLRDMYGNHPDHWSDNLSGTTRLRVICNYFTRMRYCDINGHLLLNNHSGLNDAPTGYYPWFDVPNRINLSEDIIFGHWAALNGECPHPRIHALDTGCLWGGTLTALRLQDKKRYSVPD